MALPHAFLADAADKSKFRTQVWYQTNIRNALEDLKEKRVREIDATIALADKLLKILDEPAAKPIPVPLREVVPTAADSMMTPIEPEVLDLLYKSTEKGGNERYLNERNKKAPEDKYLYRVATSWDYGWQSKLSRQRARDVNRGRLAILRETFYRKNNLAPDPIHYGEPSGGEISICSEYSCFFN